MQIVKKFKVWFAEQRLNKGLTQIELAKELGVTAFTIHNFENGKSVPRLCNVKKICDYFNVSPKEVREMIEVQ